MTPQEKALLDDMKGIWAEMQHTGQEDHAKLVQLTERYGELELAYKSLETARKRLPREGQTDFYGNGNGNDGADERAQRRQDHRTFLRAVAYGGADKLPTTSEQTDAKRIERDTYTKLIEGLPLDQKALALGDDTTGGFLAPPDYALEIIKGVQLISPIRQYARQRVTNNRSLQVPVRSGVFAAQWTSETPLRPETTGLAYSMEEVPQYEMYALVIVSNWDLEDSAFNLDQEIVDNATEQFAKAEGAAFVNGDGLKKPEGFMNAVAVSYSPGGNASALTADGIINLVYAIKSDYAAKAVMVMNRKTLGLVRLLKDSQNRYLWSPDYSQGAAATIQGIPVAEMPDMPDVAGNAFPIAIGDFSRGYMIVDHIQLYVRRLNELFAQQGQVGFLVRKRVGGQCVLPEAILKLKVSTS